MTAVVFCVKVNATTTGVIKEITVNVREKAALDSKLIMQITQDDKVEVLEKSGDWYKIKYKGTQGYVYADFVKVEDNVKEATTETSSNLESEDDEVTQNITAKLQIAKNTGVKIAPTIASNIIYTTTQTEAIELLEQVNEWSYIQVANVKGWVRNSQVQEQSSKVEEKTEEAETKAEATEKTESKTEEKTETKTTGKVAYIKYDNVNIRKEPSTDASVIEKAKLNTKVTIIKEVDSVWDKVKIGDTEGYVSKSLLSTAKVAEEKKEAENTTSRDGDSVQRQESVAKQEESALKTTTTVKTTDNTKKTTTTKSKKTESKTTKTKTTTSSSKGAEVVAYAKKFLGCKYVYGGSSPKGFDCSGFTSYVYKHFGYSISRSSVAQASEGTKVAKKDLQLGDILIYKNRSLSRIGHVGIYIGNNKMIHASEPGVGVTITDIDSASHKYPQRYVMARRILK